jgi:hypothetical protein
VVAARTTDYRTALMPLQECAECAGNAAVSLFRCRGPNRSGASAGSLVARDWHSNAERDRKIRGKG